ncbi:Hypothetical protein LUCI_1365 [Lucifera butyrica]|uniref:DUF4280 domain-containing protein n=1 Tax=Lucifera butyrica TaxID=1351585 RepID=A0A498R5P1_9FIRM|nr:DUF4280 domain-containing protein [Lucifera butyrica]VBB06150.1 Hypothetical protein LUCI_1365 [Lucifera butyrica]
MSKGLYDMGTNLSPAGGGEFTYVVRGAQTACDKGSKPSNLNIPFSHGVFLKNQPQLNTMDYVPNVNIMPYGTCSVLDGPCQPATSPWAGGKTDVLIETQPALLNRCTTACAVGGKIRITNDGQGG